MRKLLAAALPIVLLNAAAARADITSAYTDFGADKACTVFSKAADGDGDWADMVCGGWRGYPVFLYYDDARESLFYGFPPAGDLAPAWESFDAFNASGPKIEWRLDDAGGAPVPFAAIHRRFVSVADDADRKVEVLVVSKVAQPADRDGCVVGLVAATGNPDANAQARRIADKARSFVCGTDERAVAKGSVEVPSFTRAE